MEIRVAQGRDRRVLARVLGRAFTDDPVTRWLVPSGSRAAVDRMFAALVRHDHPAPGCADLLVDDDGEPVGGSLWDPPGFRPPWWHRLLASPAYLRALGPAGHVRGIALDRAFARARPAAPCWYLGEVGALRPGRGHGSALLEHRLAGMRQAAYLESSNIRNVPLYERHGFTVTQEIALPRGPVLWGMWRPGDGDSGVVED